MRVTVAVALNLSIKDLHLANISEMISLLLLIILQTYSVMMKSLIH